MSKLLKFEFRNMARQKILYIIVAAMLILLSDEQYPRRTP